jgi:uncharacterized membrane protein HdeD (DUF308 family)
MTTSTASQNVPVERGVPWWVILLTGIAAVILGILLLTEPSMTTLTLVQFFGVYLFVAGIFSIVEIFINSAHWGWKLILGIIGILAGLTILRHPLYSAIIVPTLIVIFVAIEAIIYGIVALIRAFTERSWGMGILGALTVVVGIIILFSPGVAAQGLPLIVGILAIAGGIAAVVASFRVRGVQRQVQAFESMATPPAPAQPMSAQPMPVTGSDVSGSEAPSSDVPSSDVPRSESGGAEVFGAEDTGPEGDEPGPKAE